jgi:5'-deoxynucleotidase YfbR-like HD superfamily hydrolase
MTWIQTYSGGIFDYEDIDSNIIVIEDIAAALSNRCRFNGHNPLELNYSIAEHSLILVEYALEENKNNPAKYHIAYMALLHDAEEAYVPDLGSPLKPFMPPEYKEFTTKVENKIFKDLQVNTFYKPIVKSYDQRI